MTEDLIEHANRLLSFAKQAGAKEAEVFGLDARSVDVSLRRDLVEMASESYNRGLGLRAVVRGAVGFSSTSDLSKLEMVADSAVRSARARGEDENWSGLPSREQPTHAQEIFDPAIENLDPERCLDLAMDMLEGCKSVSGVEPSSGKVACFSATELVVNSNGIEIVEKSTAMHAFLDTVAKGEGLVATGYEFDNSRMMLERLERIGQSAADLARSSLGGVKGEAGVTEVLLAPIAFTEILEYAFVPSICADNVQKGRSSLAGKIGDIVAEERLHMNDDGFLKGGMATSSFDGEGVPSQRTAVVERGVLAGFLYDTYTAGKDGKASTGNAVRGGYSGVPRVGATNLIVASDQPRDLLAETGKGVLVNGVIGAHTANSVSGDFSVEGRNVFFVENGQVGRPIRSLMLAGNVFDLLKQIRVGTDPRAVGSTITPTVKVKMKVVGS